MKFLIVIDMQNDFVTGALGTGEAKNIVPNVVNKLNEYQKNGNQIIFTQDTHFKDYMKTLEGKKLPVPHCIYNTAGWELIPEVQKFKDKFNTFYKETFGERLWKDIFYDIFNCIDEETIEEIELCGVCTDICVISNALILRAAYPNLSIKIDAKCCAGSTPEKHAAALEIMESCQIDVINK